MFNKNKEDKENLDILARRSTDKLGEIDTRIGVGTAINGTIDGKENFRLEGSFEGKVKIIGVFFLGQSGKFKGDLTADSIILEGEFNGDISGAKKVELRDSAKYKGNIAATTIAIAEGSFFEGEVKMGEENSEQISFEEKRKIRTNNN